MTAKILTICDLTINSSDNGLSELFHLRGQFAVDKVQIESWTTRIPKLLPLLEAHNDVTSFILNDVLDQSKTYSMEQFILMKPHMKSELQGYLTSPRESFRFPKLHPTFCGLLLLKYKLLIQEIALIKTNAERYLTILATSHLYSAVQKTNNCSQT